MPSNPTSARDIGNAAIREEISIGLAECTEPQRELFNRIYPELRDADIENAYDLIQRTLKKNRAGR